MEQQETRLSGDSQRFFFMKAVCVCMLCGSQHTSIRSEFELFNQNSDRQNVSKAILPYSGNMTICLFCFVYAINKMFLNEGRIEAKLLSRIMPLFPHRTTKATLVGNVSGNKRALAVTECLTAVLAVHVHSTLTFFSCSCSTCSIMAFFASASSNKEPTSNRLSR